MRFLCSCCSWWVCQASGQYIYWYPDPKRISIQLIYIYEFHGITKNKCAHILDSRNGADSEYNNSTYKKYNENSKTAPKIITFVQRKAGERERERFVARKTCSTIDDNCFEIVVLQHFLCNELEVACDAVWVDALLATSNFHFVEIISFTIHLHLFDSIFFFFVILVGGCSFVGLWYSVRVLSLRNTDNWTINEHQWIAWFSFHHSHVHKFNFKSLRKIF